ncbi:MAG: ATP-binding cassette domain-containing protein [Actinomycetota bacterium]|nr:ATP-binding cassette domain-containing protein [Actinomycetota bacterium]
MLGPFGRTGAPDHRPGSPVVLRLEAIELCRGRRVVLSDVSLDLGAGEHVAVRGANGSGKTTLLRAVANVAPPRRGRRVGSPTCAYVPAALDPPKLSVRRWLAGVGPPGGDVDPALRALAFDGRTARPVADLSFGNLRKLLLARAFSSSAGLIVIDEAHAGLDEAGREGLARLVTAAQARGAAVVLCAQDGEPAAGADRVVRTEHGRLVVSEPGVGSVSWGSVSWGSVSSGSVPSRALSSVTCTGPPETIARLTALAAELGVHVQANEP